VTTRLFPYFILLLVLSLAVKGLAQTQQHRNEDQPDANRPIAIGLLLPDHSHPGVIRAAEQAVWQANASGGFMNREFMLVIRTAEGFWGAGSKESVGLVYEDSVYAIIGSLDGRNGHLAEQVAAKSHLAYVETYATEPTLSQAFVPWFMRVVPNDNQQSSSILKQIKSNGGGRIGILSQDTYDTRYAVRSLIRAVASETGESPIVISAGAGPDGPGSIVEKILSGKIEHLVIPFDAGYMEDLIPTLRKEDPGLDIYGTLHFKTDAEQRGASWNHYEGVYLVAPADGDSESGNLSSASRPAYMLDAVNLVINAIRHAGTERQAIANYLSDSVYEGEATGSISFDNMGNRLGDPALCRIENSMPHLIY
jgi:branched-chain amino acid transport system substrate-binding protein